MLSLRTKRGTVLLSAELFTNGTAKKLPAFTIGSVNVELYVEKKLLIKNFETSK